MEEINFINIEKKWQDRWEAKKIFEVGEDSKRSKYYVLEMFPYPSGTGIHMGHAFNYVLGDILARYKILNGFNVLHPMGFDSLGLPAENAAIKAGTHPEEYTNNSIPNFILQQKTLGLTYDWSRILSTADPAFYKWDQWIFLKMLEKNLAYQKTSAVNWCPECKTVLANEQVVDGKCWRHENIDVEIKYLKQWFFRITDYADELYEDIKKLDWPNKTKAMQRNWIGKSHGTEIDFEINNKKWQIFTTRPDTIFGVTFMVISAQHQKLWDLVTEEQKKDVKKFLKKLGSISEKELADMEKLGVFTGSYAKNPVTGKNVPIYAGNFVVADYGSGMVMAVPAHDQRDFEFAKKYKIDIQLVIESPKNHNWGKQAYTQKGKLINSGEFDGLEFVKAKEKITSWLAKKGKGRKVVNFKLRDWGISRQRYWGTPIPIVHCEACGAVPVPENELPVILPKNVKFGEGNPLDTNKNWINVPCPKCGKPAKRETDTMDTFVNSSWYFLRFCDPNNSEKIFDKRKVKYWNPVDTYIGGAEHACMHLIYSRFYTKFLADLKLIGFREPFPRLYHQGMINGSDGEKMSKSKGNGIEPLDIMNKYGVDTTRFFLVSVAAPNKGFNWSDSGIQGSSRFIKRISHYLDNNSFEVDNKQVLSKLNETIKNVSNYFENFQYRKATIELRELFDLIDKEKSSKETFEKFLQLLNPICPHITEELWEKLGNKEFISTSDWPKINLSKILKENKVSDLNSKIVKDIKYILEKVKSDIKNIYLYVIPFELEKISVEKINKAVGKSIKVFAVNNPAKYDPEGKAKKAKPGKVAIYLE